MRTESATTRRWRTTRLAAVVAAAVMIAFALFQTALAVGLPWGEAAWGGSSALLTPGMRIASAAAAVFWILAIPVVLRRGGYHVWAPLPDRWTGVAVWILAGYTTLGVLLNVASHSDLERAVMGPTSLVLAVSLLLTAAGPAPRKNKVIR